MHGILRWRRIGELGQDGLGKPGILARCRALETGSGTAAAVCGGSDRSAGRPAVLGVDVRRRGTVVRTPGATLLAILPTLVLLALAPAPVAAEAGGAGPSADPAQAGARGEGPFDRQGMWIWYVDRSDGGNLSRIVARAKRFGIGTLYIKAGDGDNYWSQFNRSLVRRLQGAGLRVCAWQFVYGDRPAVEAFIGAVAARRGADCLVIDAEGQYEGKYAAADLYLRVLRARIGADFPLSLSSFPYVDYHPSFPYSVFLGPGGADVNQPQMYWKAIGTSVRAVYEHTYLYNRLWGRTIYPIGQTYLDPGRRPIHRFRRFAETYGGHPPSWWSWQETNGYEWRVLGLKTLAPTRHKPVKSHPVLRRGSRGDLVVWAQMHLRTAVRPRLPATGYFGWRTRAATRALQRKQGLRVDGIIGTNTWNALLRFKPQRQPWAARMRKHRRAARSGARASGALPLSRPLSASLPARAYEIDPGPRP